MHHGERHFEAPAIENAQPLNQRRFDAAIAEIDDMEQDGHGRVRLRAGAGACVVRGELFGQDGGGHFPD